MRAVAFSNGIGNLVIFSSIIRCLEHHFGEKLNFIYDSMRDCEVQFEILRIAKNLSSINEVVDFWTGKTYESVYMSRHNNYCQMYDQFVFTSKDNEFDWAFSGLSELAYYYNEIRLRYDYKGPIFPQEIPIDSQYDLKPFGNYFCIANGFNTVGGPAMERKAYPYWNEVVSILRRMFPKVGIVVLGGLSDYEWAKELPGVINMAGRLNILQTSALISGANAIITNDTGVFHIADALKKPTVVIFGPTLTSKNGPINNTSVVVQSPIECAPCQGRKGWFVCNDNPQCMKTIDPSMVISALLSILCK